MHKNFIFLKSLFRIYKFTIYFVKSIKNNAQTCKNQSNELNEGGFGGHQNPKKMEVNLDKPEKLDDISFNNCFKNFKY